MYPDGLVFGVVAARSPAGDAALARKLRELTIAWSRYDYRGRILEATSVGRVLEDALALGYAWCLVQATGHVIVERWHADDTRERLDECVRAWIAQGDFLAFGAVVGDEARGLGLDDGCLLVDLRRWDALGRPAFGATPVTGAGFIEASLKSGVPVPDAGPALEALGVSLGRLSPAEAHRLTGLLGDGILSDGAAGGWEDTRVGAFLEDVRRQVADARRGVFLWNLEAYDDVLAPPDGFDPPVTTLYSVAAGFKPNMILESFGFDDRTRVVFFDYSANALEVKRLLLERWDGSDFPSFARYLFRRVPAFYHLWDCATPETVDAAAMEQAWARELELWGGERLFREHWSRYRRLRHEFVHCDVLGAAAPAAVLERVEPERDAVIWWSNAFFSVYGNWLLDAAVRKRRYERWIGGLAEHNPDLFLYGSDFTNSSVNDIQAAEYLRLLSEADCDELVPLAASACEIRF